MKNNFKYALVARGTTVLADYSAQQGPFNTMAPRYLEKVSEQGQGTTQIPEGDFVIEILSSTNRLNFLVVTSKNTTTQLRTAFLESMQTKWNEKRYGSVASIQPYAKNKDFGPSIRDLFLQFNSERAERFARIQQNISEAQEITADSLTQALIRGEKLNDMEDKANSIKNHASDFQKSAKRLKQKMCWEKYRYYIFGLILLIIIALIILFSVCRFDFSKCKPKKQ